MFTVFFFYHSVRIFFFILCYTTCLINSAYLKLAVLVNVLVMKMVIESICAVGTFSVINCSLID